MELNICIKQFYTIKLQQDPLGVKKDLDKLTQS